MNQNTNEQTTKSERRSAFNPLWVSGFILTALIIMQAQNTFGLQVGGGGSARAGMVSQTGPLTVMTADAGVDDLLLVLEGRSEELLVYRADRNGVQLQQRLAIPKLFEDARAMAQGH